MEASEKMYYKKGISKTSGKKAKLRRKKCEETGRENFEIVIENVETSEVKCFKGGEGNVQNRSTLIEETVDTDDIRDYFLDKLFEEEQLKCSGQGDSENKIGTLYSSDTDRNIENVFDGSKNSAIDAISETENPSSTNEIEMPVLKAEVSDLDSNGNDILETDGRKIKDSCKEEMSELEKTESSLWDLATGYDFSVPVIDKVKVEPVATCRLQNSDFAYVDNTFDISDIRIKEESIRSIEDQDNLYSETSKTAACEVHLRDDGCDEQIKESTVTQDNIDMCNNSVNCLRDTHMSESENAKSTVRKIETSLRACNLSSFTRKKDWLKEIDKTGYAKNDRVIENVSEPMTTSKSAQCNVQRYPFRCLPRSCTFPNLTSAICNEVKCNQNPKDRTHNSWSRHMLPTGSDDAKTFDLSDKGKQNAKSPENCATDMIKDRSLWKKIDASSVPIHNTLMTTSKIKFTLKRQHSMPSTKKPQHVNKDIYSDDYRDNKCNSDQLKSCGVHGTNNNHEKVRNSSTVLATRQNSVNSELRIDNGIEDRRFSQKNVPQTWQRCYENFALEGNANMSFQDDDISIGDLKIDEESCKFENTKETKEINAGTGYNYVMLDGLMSLSLNGRESSGEESKQQFREDSDTEENSNLTQCGDKTKGTISYSHSADGNVNTNGRGASSQTAIKDQPRATEGSRDTPEKEQDYVSGAQRTEGFVHLAEADETCNNRIKVEHNAESCSSLIYENLSTKDSKQTVESNEFLQHPHESSCVQQDFVEHKESSYDSTKVVANTCIVKESLNDETMSDLGFKSEPKEGNVNSLFNDDVKVNANDFKSDVSLPKSFMDQKHKRLESCELGSDDKYEIKHFSNCDNVSECEHDGGADSDESKERVACDSYRIVKKYFMDRCTGSTLQKIVLRVKERKTYTDHELDDDEIEGKRAYKIEDKLRSDKYNKDYVKKLAGEEFNLRYLQENGLQYPILFAEKNGLGLRVPSDNFKVADVKACVGSRRMLDVMDVTTQKGLEMTMKEWTKYYETTERDRLLNVISLEFSHTKLENYVESPNLVREIDWVDTAWPQHLKDCQTESTNAIDKMKYPKVQKYCLMSVAGCYTDFHIDFGGTSVWYHILHGEKIFWLIPPTDKNLAKYENWVLSGKQGDAFLADSIEECQMIQLVAGNTFIIPSGWIHAVFTPKDSLVFGGNFLHSFNMVNQLRVAAIEDKTHVPMKFRYPFYAEINWYVLERYVHSLTGVTYLEKPQLNEDLEVISTKVERDQSSFEMLEEKLSKRLSVSLTRIDDTSPRRRSTSDDDSTASGPTRSPGQASTLPRTGRKSSSESANSFELKLNEKPEALKVPYKSPVKKKTKYVHLTKYELEGLIEVVGWVESLPPSKKGVPKDLIDADCVLREVKRLIQEHMKDNPELAITGEPVLEWTKATKKLIKLKQKAKTAKLLGTHCGPKVKTSGGKNASGNRHRRVRCKKCEPCTRDDCMECNFCKDMRKYGGPGRAKQSCISRQCLAPILPKGIICQICKLAQCMLDKPVKTDGAVDEDAEDYSSSLMECGICWEIVHPLCQRKKYETLNNDGILNEDLPNSWKCSKCCFDGKEGKLMARVFKGGWRPNPTSTPPPLSISPPPQPQSPGVIVTEGKRVTSTHVMDSKKTVMPKLSPSPEHREIISKLDIDTDHTSIDTRSMTPPQLKTETLDTVRTNGINMDVSETFPVKSHDIKMEVTDPLPVKKNEPAEEPVRSYSKRSSSPLQENPVKKKRNVSPSPSRFSKSSRVSGQTKTTPSTSSKSGKSASVDHSTKRSKREITQKSAPWSTYDFDEEEYMDVSVPLPDKGKGKGLKGRKNLHLKNKDFGAKLSSDVNSKSRMQTVEQKSEEHGHLVKKSSEKLCNDQLKQTLIAHIERRNLPVIKPRFVVRPAPISPPDDYCIMVNGQKHQLSRKLWTCVFNFLPSADLARCQAVCQTWNRWCINPDLWKKIDLSKKRIVQTHLMGIVRRQPEYLDLSAVIMTQKQILWLLERIPLLKTLIVSKCSWATISGLCMSACPLLHKLDVSWATGLNDKCFEDLISPPVDRKPGLKNISRLHRLKSIHLSGTEITDVSLELMTLHLSQLEELNVSYCTRITDRGIQILASSKSATQDSLKVLNISGCRGLTEVSLDAIKNFSKLKELYAVNCIRIPAERCRSLRHSRLNTFRF